MKKSFIQNHFKNFIHADYRLVLAQVFLILIYGFRDYDPVLTLSNHLVTGDIVSQPLAILLKENLKSIYWGWLLTSLLCLSGFWLTGMSILNLAFFASLVIVINSIGHVFHVDLVPLFALICLTLNQIAPRVDPKFLFKIFISQMYFLSALSKIKNAGFNWIDGTNLSFAIKFNMVSRDPLIDDVGRELGYFLLNHSAALSLFSVGVLLIEILSPFLIFWRNATFFLALISLFHASNYFILGLQFTEFWLILIFLIDWHLIVNKLSRVLKGASRIDILKKEAF